MPRLKQKAPPADSRTAFDGLYPGFFAVNDREAGMVDLPGSAAAYFPVGVTGNGIATADQSSAQGVFSSEEAHLVRQLPRERQTRYLALEIMAEDPTIDCAIKMHMAHALSARSDTGQVVSIESVTDDKDPIVNDLRNTLQARINRELNEWAYNAAVYGAHYVRVYGGQQKGITNIRSDYYTHPRFIKKFEKAGQLAGFTTTYQGTTGAHSRIRLMPPWAFVGFEIPQWKNASNTEPVNIGVAPVDLSSDDYATEAMVESQEYGSSLIETAYQPWLDLLDAICSLNASRRNAARLERLIGVSTGRLDPEKAAKYLNLISSQILNTDREIATQSLRRGFVQTVINRIFPMWGDKARMEVNTVQGTPDINGLEDVFFHVKRLGGALGVDPSMLGFGDFLSGGLGDGGFYRVSIMAALKANFLRQAIQNGVQRLCEIHVAYKHKKIFLPGQQPWRIVFNSVSTALEREEQENLESRTNIASGLAGIIATLDQEYTTTDRRALMNFLWTHILKKDEESFKQVFPENMASQTPPNSVEDDEDSM
ncbi:portal protein [uncultured Desulfovibrio sp.]|uniref:portal protein n=1 Tax=uncultured Desulfovibrio sp. TaxID=167968 RepID=UPI0026733341|nr:portal protein [uncultured Desulfovibrio sp.]